MADGPRGGGRRSSAPAGGAAASAPRPPGANPWLRGPPCPVAASGLACGLAWGPQARPLAATSPWAPLRVCTRGLRGPPARGAAYRGRGGEVRIARGGRHRRSLGMVRVHDRKTIVRWVVGGLLLLWAGLAPVLVAPELLTRPFLPPEVRDRPLQWHERAIPFLILGAALGGAGVLLWGVLLALHPGWHPVFRRLAPFGPPHEVAAEIDAELAQRGEVVRFGDPVRSFRLASNLYG